MTQLAGYDRVTRCILMMSPSAESYRNVCLQVYAKDAPSTFQVDTLYVRRAFRTLRVEDRLARTNYFYKLPNGRCDGPHLFTIDDMRHSKRGAPAITSMYYCCNGIPHGYYFGSYYDECMLRTTLHNGLFNGPATIIAGGVAVRQYHYVDGYIRGLFTGEPALSLSLRAPRDVTCTYAAVYGPVNRPLYRCDHKSTSPCDISHSQVYAYRNTVHGHKSVKRTFIGGPLNGTLTYRLMPDILVECAFDNGVQHGPMRAWKDGQIFCEAHFVDGKRVSRLLKQASAQDIVI